jgi:hypothetical protein
VTGAIVLAILVPTMLPAILELTQGRMPGVATIIPGGIGVLIGIILGAIIRALFITFNLAVWTLAFCQFTGMAPTLTPSATTPPLPPAERLYPCAGCGLQTSRHA